MRVNLITIPTNGYIVRLNKNIDVVKQFYLQYGDIPLKVKTNVDFTQLWRSQFKIMIMIHPTWVEEIKRENSIVTWRYITFTSKPKDIKIHGKTIKVTQIGTYKNKDGKEVPQYAAEASCIIKTTQENFDLIFEKVAPEKYGLNEEKLTKIRIQMKEWENKQELNFDDHFKELVEKFQIIDKITENKGIENKPKYDE